MSSTIYTLFYTGNIKRSINNVKGVLHMGRTTPILCYAMSQLIWSCFLFYAESEPNSESRMAFSNYLYNCVDN